MIEPRIYRVAFLPALLAAVVTMFALESQPRGVPQAAAADVLFEGTSATSTTRSIVERTPDRRVGTPGDAAAAQRVAGAFRRFRLTTTVDRWSDDGRQLVNVVGRRPGVSRRQVVVLVPRDALSVPDATGTAADTAALIEFGRVLEGRATRKTIVLASVDGSTRGEEGARRAARKVAEEGPVEALVVLTNLGVRRPRGPLLVGASNDDSRVSIGLRRTAANALRNEVGDDGGGFGSPLTQFGRLAFPAGIGTQAVLLEDGRPAIRISGSGELAPPRERRELDDLGTERYEELGRAGLRLMFTLDESARPPEHGPRSYITLAGRVAPRLPLAMLALALILPVLVASVDALARARRRHEVVLPWVGWVVAGVLPFAFGLALAELLVLVGLADDAPPTPLDPSAAEIDGGAAGVLAGLVVAIGVAFFLVRRSAPARRDPSGGGAGVVVSLGLCALALAAWAINPYTAFALVLPLHVWMLAVLADARARTRVWLVLVGLLPAAVIVGTYALHLRMGPLDGAWYLFLLVTGHHVGLISALLGCVALGLLAAVVAIVVTHARRSEPAPAHVPGRGGRRPVDDRSVSGPAGPPLERVRR
ncbi:MAG: hypothetical protein M3340_02865 [Actinomycetota bacterium]|nr:hypothetical protein [Actinomycetota bacterium]